MITSREFFCLARENKMITESKLKSEIRKQVRNQVSKKLIQEGTRKLIEIQAKKYKYSLVEATSGEGDLPATSGPSISLGKDSIPALNLIAKGIVMTIPGLNLFAGIVSPLIALGLRMYINNKLTDKNIDPLIHIEKVIKRIKSRDAIERTGKVMRFFMLTPHKNKPGIKIENVPAVATQLGELSDYELGVRYFTVAFVTGANNLDVIKAIKEVVNAASTKFKSANLKKAATAVGDAILGSYGTVDEKKIAEIFSINTSNLDPVYKALFVIVPTPHEDAFVEKAVLDSDISEEELSSEDEINIEDADVFPNFMDEFEVEMPLEPGYEGPAEAIDLIPIEFEYDDDFDLDTEEMIKRGIGTQIPPIKPLKERLKIKLIDLLID